MLSFPTFERHLVRLRFLRNAKLHFLHGGALRGLLSRALGRHDLPDGLLPHACESGRVRYEAGAAYHFELTLVGECRGLLNDLLAGLRQAGAEPLAAGPAPRLGGGNFEVEGVTPLASFPPDELSARLGHAGELSLQFLSPLRLRRPERFKVPGATYLDQRCFPGPHFLERLLAWSFKLAEGRFPASDELQRLLDELPPPGRALPVSLTWLDLPIEGDGSKRPYTLGGCVGRVRFESLAPEWLRLLAFGEAAHAGENVHFGLGRFRIEEAAPWQAMPLPARSLLDAASEIENLRSARDHVRAQFAPGGDDWLTARDLDEGADAGFEALSASLRGGTYRPGPSLGVVQSKPGSTGLRALAIPRVVDRVAQRAAVNVLAPAVDGLLEDCSFAYRKGFSRGGAARAVQQAYEDGFRWVLDADISSFFDSVDWERMTAKLEALFPCEPLVALLSEWMRAPVMYDGRRIERYRGLPQGAPISPMLANLFLDELDEELLGRDYRLVRYADDFVVLCKNLEQAERAREDARRILAGLALELNLDKTAVRSLDDGFSYLGYLFCRSLAIDGARADEPTGGGQEGVAGELQVPRHSWLAQVPLASVRALRPPAPRRRTAVEEPPLGTSAGDAEVLPLVGAESGSDSRVPVYVSHVATQLWLEGDTMVVHSPGEPERRYPADALSHLVLLGRTRATVPLLAALARQGVPTYLCDRSGEVESMLAAPSPDTALWLAQVRLTEEAPARTLEFAREVVAAKLHNATTLAVRFAWPDHVDLSDQLRALERSAQNAESLDTLRGLEGRAAALYFASIAAALPAEWGFHARRRRPAPDPVNAFLSFGYSILHHHLTTAVLGRGLHPRLGILHAAHGAHAALASDLVEEFRCLVDALVWSLITQKRAKPADFEPSADGRFPCLMRRPLRDVFLQELEERFETRITPDSNDERGPRESVSYRELFDRQAYAVLRFVRSEALYHPFRLHA